MSCSNFINYKVTERRLWSSN